MVEHERVVSRYASGTFVAKLLDAVNIEQAFSTCSVLEKWGKSVRDLARIVGQGELRAAGLRKSYTTTLQRQVRVRGAGPIHVYTYTERSRGLNRPTGVYTQLAGWHAGSVRACTRELTNSYTYVHLQAWICVASDPLGGLEAQIVRTDQ